MTVRAFDPADEADLRAAWDLKEADAALRPYDDSTPWETFRVQAQTARSDHERTWLLAEDDGRTVGVGQLTVWTMDNPHLADLGVIVHPDHRRRGAGADLLAELERRAVASGRTSWTGGFHAPLDDDGAGGAFATAHGYTTATSEEVKLVDLDAAMPGWPALDDDVASRLGDYRVETFTDRVPDQWRQDVLDLFAVFLEAMPTGDLDLQNATWTPQRLREHEERFAAAGQSWVTAVAVAPDGRLGGFSEVYVQRAQPGSSWIGGTLVVPDHRGHRLGLGMKLASHRLLRERFPDARFVLTGNAGVNAPMNAVNEAMGYRVVERYVDVQKRVQA